MKKFTTNLVQPSNRSFSNLLFAIAVIAPSLCYLKSKTYLAIIILVIDFFLLAVILIRPKTLGDLNKLWFSFSLLLSKISTPFILGIIYFLFFTPIALLLRVLGRDELLLTQKNITSYWIDRTNKNVAPESFKNQF